MGTELESKSGDTTDTVRVYNYVEAPVRKPFGQVYDVDDGNLAVAADGTHDGLVAASAFASGAGTVTHVLNTDTDDAGTVPDIFQIRGTFAGAVGTYRCGGDGTQTCTSSVTEAGVRLAGAGATWTFDPDNGAMAEDADDAYQYFGWWLRNDADGEYLVNVFHGGVVPTGTTPLAITTLEGSATYVGSAAGKFALNSLLGGGAPKAGHFTAAARLEVDFDGSNPGTIEGTVDNFMSEGNAMPWSVELQSGALVDAGTKAATDTATSPDVVWTISGEDGDAAGTWSAALHEAGTDNVPKAVTGQFLTNFNDDDGHLIGAFGAVRQ